MAAPHGTHGEGAAAGDPAAADARQIRSLELESAVEVLRARVLELGATEAIPEKAATDVAGAQLSKRSPEGSCYALLHITNFH